MQQSATPQLILGGSRSGKSSYAESLITKFESPWIYIATAQVLDSEMKDRVAQHRDRRGSEWETIEAPLHLIETMKALESRSRPVLVDCLTLWLTNLLLDPDRPSPEREIDRLCEYLPVTNYPLFLVSNEVGTGIVPENALARRFRDLAGHANQRVAAVCSSVTMVIAGIPLVLK
jgi:adenosylcobinamide kinase / adenosylcobinamide-phosphate guanylyltransferase